LLRRIAALSERAIVGEHAVDDGPVDADAADTAAVGAAVAESFGPTEGAVDHGHRLLVELTEHADRAAAHVGALLGAGVVEKTRVDHLEPTTPHPDGSTAVVFFLVLRIRVDERQVLHRKARVILIVAMSGGPVLSLVAGVHVEDTRRTTAAERH